MNTPTRGDTSAVEPEAVDNNATPPTFVHSYLLDAPSARDFLSTRKLPIDQCLTDFPFLLSDIANCPTPLFWEPRNSQNHLLRFLNPHILSNDVEQFKPKAVIFLVESYRKYLDFEYGPEKEYADRDCKFIREYLPPLINTILHETKVLSLPLSLFLPYFLPSLKY
jgi:hypothetical protein